MWTAWVSLGGVGQSVTVAPNRQGLVDVFVKGSDGAAWTRSETASGLWTAWTGLGGVVSSLTAGHPRELCEQAAFALLDYIEEYTDGFRILVRDSPIPQ